MIANIIIGLFSRLVLAMLILGLISSVGDIIQRQQQMNRRHLEATA